LAKNGCRSQSNAFLHNCDIIWINRYNRQRGNSEGEVVVVLIDAVSLSMSLRRSTIKKIRRGVGLWGQAP